jgi:hypothetical protein
VRSPGWWGGPHHSSSYSLRGGEGGGQNSLIVESKGTGARTFGSTSYCATSVEGSRASWSP